MADEPGDTGPASARARLDGLLAERIMVCDGATGTMLHSAGVPLDRPLSELNVTRPGLVRDLHAAYVTAGAGIVQSNTFDANRLRLARFGLADKVAEINIAGARLAREAAQQGSTPVLVAGSVGPATAAATPARHPSGPRIAALREQIAALADWVDLVLLETYGDIESVLQAVEATRGECDLPVIAQMTFGDDGRTLRGEEPAEVAGALGALQLSGFGANCTVGPAVLVDVVAELAAHASLPVSVQPNAGTPQRRGRRVRYAHDPGYFAESARQFVASGATVVGGCCGTTPAHIRAIAKAVAGLAPVRGAPVRGAPAAPPVRASLTLTESRLEPAPDASWPDPDGFVVIAGMAAPMGDDVAGFIEHATALRSAGAELLAIMDPAPPRARVNPVAAAVVLRERVGTDVLLPVETVDRSLVALQADLLGAHALGLRIVVCRTGSPRVVGDYPDPGTRWDVDSAALIATLHGLNEGVDWRGVATAERTGFVVGAMITTWAADIGTELDRAEEKVRAGAHFLTTNVIYDVDKASGVLGALRARGVTTPVIASLAPFMDPRTVQRMSHEVPEVSIASSALAALRRSSGEPQHAVEAALDAAKRLRGLVCGVTVQVPRDARPHAVELIARLRSLR